MKSNVIFLIHNRKSSSLKHYCTENSAQSRKDKQVRNSVISGTVTEMHVVTGIIWVLEFQD